VINAKKQTRRIIFRVECRILIRNLAIVWLAYSKKMAREKMRTSLRQLISGAPDQLHGEQRRISTPVDA
jgi:ferredoxin